MQGIARLSAEAYEQKSASAAIGDASLRHFTLKPGKATLETGSPMTASTTKGSFANRRILVVVETIDLSVV
jgi:hypothetical protein